jgi:glycerophosphoryl diester phosphodiesterase
VYVPFLDHPRPIAFAHRGGAAHAPENSWPAFEHAVKLGYAYLETDARATFDGKLMAFHDRNLERVTDAEGPINMKSYREVAALRVAGSEPIPLIEDLLGAWPGVRFNIDVKDEAGIPLLPGVLRRTSAWDRVCLTSFSAARGCGLCASCSTTRSALTTSPSAIAAVRYSRSAWARGALPGLRGLWAQAGPRSRRPGCWPGGSSGRGLLRPGAGPGGHPAVRPPCPRPRP